MQSHIKTNWRGAVLPVAVATVLGASASAWAVSQSGEAVNMIRVGHTDLQGRPTYQPNVIQYPDGRTMLFVGQHSGNPLPSNCPNNSLPNPFDGGACENNGTMIIDVTDPRNPVEQILIPAPPGGQSQMVRMCLGSEVPGGVAGKVYLLRNVQGGAQAGYQLYDVTNPKAPVLKKALTGIRSTHKHWWECSTGIAYMPGSLNVDVSTGKRWRQAQSMVIYDWSNPEDGQPPVYIRAFGLPGGQPDGTGVMPPTLHGPISAHDHPRASQPLTRARTIDDVIGNRIYAAWGVGDNGVMTILDRKKLLTTAYGGTYTGDPDKPTEADLIGPDSPVVGYFLMSPDQGGHTSMPVFGLKPPSMQSYNEFATRDVVLLASEATADGVDGRCNEPPHYSFIVDVTVENSMTAPPGTRVQRDPYQGPMVLSTMSVDPRAGEKYARGNYCARGARFGVHSSEENFNNPYYGTLTALAYFNGGVRIWDIREPQAPREVAFYVPEANANTNPDGYMTNNVEIDDRGYIYVVDRNGAGMDILQLTGCAKQITEKGGICKSTDANNAATNGN